MGRILRTWREHTRRDDVEAGPVAGRRTSRVSPDAAATANPQCLETEQGGGLLRASAAAERSSSSRSACCNIVLAAPGHALFFYSARQAQLGIRARHEFILWFHLVCFFFFLLFLIINVFLLILSWNTRFGQLHEFTMDFT